MTGPVTVRQAVVLKNMPGIELVAVGTWRASTGELTLTTDDLASAVAAMDCPGVRNPVLKLGHSEPDSTSGIRWDGEPAVGWVDNMRLSDNRAKIVADYLGVPAWLAEVMPSAYPDRSIEISRPFRCQIGHQHPAVITAVALLGIVGPAVGVLRSLQDVQDLYTTPGTSALSIHIGDREVLATVSDAPQHRPQPPIRITGATRGRRVRLAFNPNQARDSNGKWTSGVPGHPNWSGLTDEQFSARTSLVEKMVGGQRHTLSTDKTHTTGPGAWTPERDRLHREIAEHLYAKSDHVPRDGKAVIAGGLGGAGKTTVLTKHAGVDTSQYMTINPDDIKEELAQRGMIPAVPGAPDLSPMERAALVHEESSRIAHLMADRAYAEKRNLIWDITMSSESSVKSRVKALDRAGYTEVVGVFVDIPVETSVERAMARYRRGVDQYLSGSGFGGRYVPPNIIRAQKTSTGATINRTVFEDVRKGFTQSYVYDNSVTGEPPRLVG